MKRFASVNWKGSGKEGKGSCTTQSGVLENTPYSYNTRFAEGKGTNPEELIAAAHAQCFTMKTSFVLGAAGFTPDNLDTKCTITLEDGAITGSHIEMKATVPGISEEQFKTCIDDAKANCLISKTLNTTTTVDAKLV